MDIDNFFDNLQNKLTDALLFDSPTCIEQGLKDEYLYGMALVTDSDFVSLYIAFNTEESLEQRKDYYKQCKSSVPDTYLRWTPAEWAYDDSDFSINLKEVRALLRGANIERNTEFETRFFETLIRAMKVIKEENRVGAKHINNNALTLFISISDDDRAEAVENYSANLLNPISIFQPFSNRYNK